MKAQLLLLTQLTLVSWLSLAQARDCSNYPDLCASAAEESAALAEQLVATTDSLRGELLLQAGRQLHALIADC